MTLRELRDSLRRLADPVRAAGALRFFKTGPGEYGEGDHFLGVTVPATRSLLPRSDALRCVAERSAGGFHHPPASVFSAGCDGGLSKWSGTKMFSVV